MKLYATTSSERATKGQGGKYLDIKIMDKHKHELWHIVVVAGAEANMMTVYKDKNNIFEDITKGKRQKGE